MHKSFYKLDCEPFDIQPDQMFLWMGEKYKEALSVLRYGILDNKGFLLLTGESGIGKTTLLRALAESLPPDVLWAFIPNPDVPKMEMFNAIGRGFGMDKEYNSKVEFMLDLGIFLQERHDENKKMLLIIDSAHLISQENLEELRLLSNIERADTKLIHIFFSAQPSFGAILTRPRNSAIRQRLSLTHTIEPLTMQETAEYIEHRFSVAGVENRILTEKAIHSVQHFSGGIPKKINIICQQLLIEGAKQGRRVIDQGAVQECMRKFSRSDDSNRKDFAAGPMRGQGGEPKNFNRRPLIVGIGALALAIIILGAGYFVWRQRGREDLITATPMTSMTVAAPSVAANSVPAPAAPVKPVPQSPTALPEPAAPALADTSKIMIDRIAAKPVAPPADHILNQTDIPDRPGTDNGMAREPAATTVTISPITGLATVRPIAGTDAPPAAANQPSVGTVAKQGDIEEIIIDPSQTQTEVSASTAKTVPPVTQGDGIWMADRTSSQAVPPGSAASVATLPPVGAKTLPQVNAILPLRGNSRSLTSEGDAALDDFVRKFKEIGRGKIEVRGYVSSDNSSMENTRLSVRRAENVQAMLIRAGVDRASIVVRGMGVQNPLAGNNTPEGRDKNRRVELEIIP